MTRRGWAIAVLAAWTLSLAWLAKRELFRPTAARLADAARAIPPGATFFRLDMGGSQLGFASSTIDTLGDSLRVDQVLVLEVPTLGRLSRTSARSVAVVGRSLQLRSLDVRFDSDLDQFVVVGSVAGDSVLRLTLVSAGDTQTARVPLSRSSVLPALLPFRLAFGGGLKPGAGRDVRLFDPVLLAERDLHVTVVRESTLVVPDSADFDSTAMAWIPLLFDTVPAVRIDLGALSTWVDAQGRVVRATNPAGYTVERSAFEIAYENFRRRDTRRAVRASASPPRNSVIPTTALAAGADLAVPARATLRLRISGAVPSSLGAPGQRVRGDTLELRTAADPVARYRLSELPDPALARWLAAEPLVQSDNPRIRAQARLLVGRERDPVRVSKTLLHWVGTEVRAASGAGLPSAVRVFETRRGDCNEHAVLYVALARAAGIPARTVSGVLALGGRYYYHAWSEVYLDEWTAVDPLLGQFPADAGHLRLAVGGLARQVELIPLAGAMRLEER